MIKIALRIFVTTVLVLTPVVHSAGWQLVWSDEFNGLKISPDWSIITDDGYPNEKQYYKKENARIQNGKLVLDVKIEKNNYNNKEYTSAKLNSTRSWRFGKFEIRAKLPKGKSLWPAIWMMPQKSVYGKWPASGEMDILEARGEQSTRIEGTLHYGQSRENKGSVWSQSVEFPFDFSQDFHTFGYQWDNKYIRWLVDDKEYFSTSTDRNFQKGFYKANVQPFDQPFYMILNVAVGGDFFGPKDDLKKSEAEKWEQPRMEIDWIRVYRAV